MDEPELIPAPRLLVIEAANGSVSSNSSDLKDVNQNDDQILIDAEEAEELEEIDRLMATAYEFDLPDFQDTNKRVLTSSMLVIKEPASR